MTDQRAITLARTFMEQIMKRNRQRDPRIGRPMTCTVLNRHFEMRCIFDLLEPTHWHLIIACGDWGLHVKTDKELVIASAEARGNIAAIERDAVLLKLADDHADG